MTLVDLVVFRRVGTVVMVLLMAAFLFVLFAGFIGGIGLEHAVLALQPTVPVTAEVTSCGYSGRTKTCSGRYTVDGVESTADMPVEFPSRGWTSCSFAVAASCSPGSRSDSVSGGLDWRAAPPPNSAR